MSGEKKACCGCGCGCSCSSKEERKKLNKEEVLRYSDMEIFKGIEKENLNALLYCMKSYVRSYKKGEIIHLEENQEKHVGVVLYGSIDMIKTDVWGKETLLTYMGEGEIFGETFGNSASEDEYVSVLSGTRTESL